MNRRARFRGLILGTAVGDAPGYLTGNMSPRRIARLFRGRWRHRFILRVGGSTLRGIVRPCLGFGPAPRALPPH